jgi:hypothetical protein
MKQNYVLNSIKQIIELNNSITNFELHFEITSKQNEPFDIIVATEQELEQNPDLEYKRTTGSISGDIISDKNVYQNYILILKSDTPNEVELDIDIKEIEAKEDFTTINKDYLLVKKVILVLGVIGILSLLYYLYNKYHHYVDKNEDSKESLIENDNDNNTNMILEKHINSPQEVLSSDSDEDNIFSPSPNTVNKLLERYNLK